MYSGRKPRTQPDAQRNERSGPPRHEQQHEQQQDAQDNNQGHWQGGGGSSVKVRITLSLLLSSGWGLTMIYLAATRAGWRFPSRTDTIHRRLQQREHDSE